MSYFEPLLSGTDTHCDPMVHGTFSLLLTNVSLHTTSYALHVVIAVSTLVVLLRHGSKHPNRRKHTVFTALLLVLGSINIILYLLALSTCNSLYQEVEASQLSRCIDWARAQGEYPQTHPSPPPYCRLNPQNTVMGVSSHYKPRFFAGPDYTRGQDIVALFISLLAQSYLLLRCHSLLGRRIVTGGMGVLLLLGLGFGVFNIIKRPVDPTPNFMLPDLTGTANTSRAFWSISLSFNLGANAFIIGRLIWLRRRVAASVLGKEYGKIYTGLAAMLMESSALYTVVLVLAYTLLPGQGGAASMFSPVVAQTEAIAAELIILRFALGRSLSRKDVVTMTLTRDPGPKSNLAADADSGVPGHAPENSDSRGADARHSMISSISQFPSTVAAALMSHLGGDQGSGPLGSTGSVSQRRTGG